MCTSLRCDRPDPTARARVTQYATVHQWLRRRRGPASAQMCPCGRPAAQWAYTGPRAPGEQMPYSTNLDEYAARCKPCHMAMDAAAAR